MQTHAFSALGMRRLMSPASVRVALQAATSAAKKNKTGGTMIRPRSADDFGTIRARMEELRRERDGLSVESGPLSVNEPSLYDAADARLKTGKPGVPGWRVTRRKRFTTS